MIRRFQALLLVLAMSALLVPAALAQETTGSFTGTVTDPDGSPVVAAILLVGPTGQRTVLSGEDGRFLAGFLKPGLYRVTITAPDHPTVEDEVRIHLGQRLNRSFMMVPPMEESMRVFGAQQPAIESGAQNTGANITTEVAESIPLGQNVSSMVLLAPGVKDGGGTGNANPSISGSSGLENQYIFNGANVTNAGYGALGSYSIVHGSQGQGINYHFVEETQVTTGSFSADKGQATGGIVNVLTKSGTNEWKGSVFGYFTPTGFQASFLTPDLSPPLAPVHGVERMNYGFDIGGPIVKDKAFFWLGLNPSRTNTTRRSPGPEYGIYDEGPLTLNSESLAYAAKLTFLPAPEHRIDLTFFGDPSKTNLSFNRGSATLRQPDRRQFSKLDYGGDNWVLGYQGQVRPDFLIDATLSNANNTFDETFPKEYDSHRIIDLVPTYFGMGSERAGGIGFYEASESDNTQLRLKFTNFISDHELSYGFGTENIDYTNQGGYTGPNFTAHDGQTSTTGAIAYRDLDCSLLGDARVTESVLVDDDALLADLGCPTGAPVQVPVVYSIVRGKLSAANIETHSDYHYAFVQDDWSITPAITLSVGMRWEKETLEGRDTSYDLPHEWSPRIGIAWDHLGDGRSKLYANFGRFHEKVPLDIAVRLFSNEVQVLNGDYFDEDLTVQVPCGTPPDPVTGRCDRYRSTGFGTTDVVPGTRTSRVDEMVLGYQRQMGSIWTLKGEWQYRELKRVLEDFQLGSASGIELGTDDFGNYVVGNIPPSGMTAPGTGFRKPKRDYQSLVLSAVATTSRWHFTGQYTLSSLVGNYEGLFRNDNGQSDPNLTSLFDFPDEDLFYFTNKSGKLNTDRTHRLQAYGYYKWSNGWTVGSRFLAQSGTPKLALASHPVYGNQGEISLARRGALGRTPTAWNADFNVSKEFKLNDKLNSSISIEVDIFNFFNHRYATDFDYNIDSASNVEICPWDDTGDADGNGVADNIDAGCPTLADAQRILVASIQEGPPNPDYGKATAYNSPREMRIGFKWKF